MNIKIVYRIHYKYSYYTIEGCINSDEIFSIDFENEPTDMDISKFVDEVSSFFNIIDGELIVKKIYLTWH